MLPETLEALTDERSELRRRWMELERLRAEAERRRETWHLVQRQTRRVRASRQAAGVFHRRQRTPARCLRPSRGLWGAKTPFRL